MMPWRAREPSAVFPSIEYAVASNVRTFASGAGGGGGGTTCGGGAARQENSSEIAIAKASPVTGEWDAFMDEAPQPRTSESPSPAIHAATSVPQPMSRRSRRAYRIDERIGRASAKRVYNTDASIVLRRFED